MPLYTQESLDHLRDKIDLVEVLESYVPLKRAGGSYKALCPFHEEKSPSFVVQRGDSHYHCFGCGAHGDAIAFLMGHVKMSFVEAVDSLAERFNILLEKSEGGGEPRGPRRAELKEAMEYAKELYHFLLLHSEEGLSALDYLYGRGITLDFIRFFKLGYAPRDGDTFKKLAQDKGFPLPVLEACGLLTSSGRDFFSERITFPITDPFGATIAFSARKFREGGYGGKYINTPETPLFKKSQTLFGLSYSRQRLTKEKRAMIVEGQLDALRLIHAGLDFTVAGQGTAIGEGHVKVLTDLGITEVLLALDGDEAGAQAAVKIGNLFQKKGVGVSVITLPEGSDPDALVRSEGADAFTQRLKEGQDYLSFLVAHFSRSFDLSSPAQKNQMIQTITGMIKGWDEPVMIHESLRKVAELTKVPEGVVGVGTLSHRGRISKFGFAEKTFVDPDRILEVDLLRWLILRGSDEPRLIALAKLNLTRDHFRNAHCRKLYAFFLEQHEKGLPCDLIAFGSALDKEEEQTLLAQVVDKRVNLEKAEAGLKEVIECLLLREWMDKREAIKAKIQSGECSDTEVLELAKEFDKVKKVKPEVALP
jgi:DNA primase